MSFDSMPVWVLLLATLGLIAFALQAGFLIGKRRRLRGAGKSEGAGAMVGATMGLLSFMLAFTFNGAAGRHDARRALVIDEANAIDQTWLRAGLLAEPYRTDIRGLLRTYVDLRVKAGAGEMDLGEATRQSETLHERMWALAEEVGNKDTGSITDALFIQSLNEVIDLHLKRVNAAIRRVPPTIWVTLYLLLVVGMVMVGTQIGLGGARQIAMELALAGAFSVVLFVIADLDRPLEGTISASQQAMVELQTKLNTR